MACHKPGYYHRDVVPHGDSPKCLPSEVSVDDEYQGEGVRGHRSSHCAEDVWFNWRWVSKVMNVSLKDMNK